MLLVLLAISPSSEAAITSIPDGAGGTIPCTVQTGAHPGQRWCSGIFTTWDGAPIDINVGFPPAPATGPDGNFIIVGNFHGWGGSKLALTNDGLDRPGLRDAHDERPRLGQLVRRRGPEAHPAGVPSGYNHVSDTRYEVRDAQEVLEALADAPAGPPTA